MTIAFFVILIVLFNTESILNSFGQDPLVSYYTQSYLVYYAPGFYLYSLCDLYRKFLNCFQLSFLPMVSFVISVGLHPLWCYLFIVQFKLDLLGIAYAGFITNLMNLSLMLWFYHLQKDLRDSKVPFSDSRSFEGLFSYFMIGVLFIAITLLDYWQAEVMTVICGFLSVEI